MKLDLMRRHIAGLPGGSRRFRRTLLARLTAVALLPLLLSGGVPMAPAAAQPFQTPPSQNTSGQNGRIIRDIKFQGNAMLPDETLRYYLGLETGQPFDENQLNENIRELWNRSLLDDLQVEATPAAPSSSGETGVNLVITIKE